MSRTADKDFDLEAIAFQSAVKKADKLYSRSKGMAADERKKIREVIDKELFDPVDELHESLESAGEKNRPWILADVLYSRIDRLYQRCEEEVERLIYKTSSEETSIEDISNTCDSLDSSFLKTQNASSSESSDGSGYESDDEDTMQLMDVSSFVEKEVEENCAESEGESMDTDEIYTKMCEEMCKRILSDVEDIEKEKEIIL